MKQRPFSGDHTGGVVHTAEAGRLDALVREGRGGVLEICGDPASLR